LKLARLRKPFPVFARFRAGAVAPNRLATIQVIVRVDRGAAALGAQNITLTTMRAE
jgi:hypothetical protein